MKTTLLTSIFLLALAASVPAQVAAPRVIPMQARLTKQDGTVYANTNYTIFFQLYDQPVGGSVLWSERHRSVGIINGMINVFLGSIKSFDATDNPKGVVTFDKTRYLGITVDADDNPNTSEPEMVPRQMIIPAFWAKTADNATQLGGYTWTDLLGNSNPAAGIPGSRLQAGSITASQISPTAITGSLIVSNTITSNNIANGTITAVKRAPLTWAISDPVSYTYTANLFDPAPGVDVPGLTVTLTTTGRPVFIGLMSGTNGAAPPSGTAPYASYVIVNVGGGDAALKLGIVEVNGQISTKIGFQMFNAGNTYVAVPSSSVWHIYQPAAGTYTYKIQILYNHGSSELGNVRLVAYEL